MLHIQTSVFEIQSPRITRLAFCVRDSGATSLWIAYAGGETVRYDDVRCDFCYQILKTGSPDILVDQLRSMIQGHSVTTVLPEGVPIPSAGEIGYTAPWPGGERERNGDPVLSF